MTVACLFISSIRLEAATTCDELVSSTGISPELDVQLYRELRNLVTPLIDQFPPDKAVILGIGQSPTPVLAFLEATSSHYAYDLPLSSFRSRLDGPPAHARKRFPWERWNSQWIINYYTPLTPMQELALFAHFDRFVPSSEVLGHRRLLVIDYVNWGDSLVAAAEYLKKYLRINGRDNEVIQVGIVRQKFDTPAGRETVNLKDVRTIMLPLKPDSRLEKLFKAAAFDRFSPYGSFPMQRVLMTSPDATYPAAKVNRGYLDLVQQVRTFIRHE